MIGSLYGSISVVDMVLELYLDWEQYSDGEGECDAHVHRKLCGDANGWCSGKGAHSSHDCIDGASAKTGQRPR